MSHRKAPAVKNDAPGMKGQRGRNDNGSIRQKRGDTLVSAIEQQYHVDFNVKKRHEAVDLAGEVG